MTISTRSPFMSDLPAGAKKPGRGGLDFIPLVKRGETTIMVSTPEEAEEMVAFLNYCGMSEFAAG
jgi:hypothetical protein